MIFNKHIKKAIIYAFIYIYGFALVKPITPIVNDVIQHTFYKMEHLATVHFENGSYHVHAELATEQKEESKENLPSSIYETLAYHLNIQELKINVCPTYSFQIFSSKKYILSTTFIKQPTPPPKA